MKLFIHSIYSSHAKIGIIILSSQTSVLQEFMGFPGGSDGKESACNAGDLGLIPGLGRSEGGHGNLL